MPRPLRSGTRGDSVASQTYTVKVFSRDRTISNGHARKNRRCFGSSKRASTSRNTPDGLFGRDNRHDGSPRELRAVRRQQGQNPLTIRQNRQSDPQTCKSKTRQTSPTLVACSNSSAARSKSLAASLGTAYGTGDTATCGTAKLRYLYPVRILRSKQSRCSRPSVANGPSLGFQPLPARMRRREIQEAASYFDIPPTPQRTID